MTYSSNCYWNEFINYIDRLLHELKCDISKIKRMNTLWYLRFFDLSCKMFFYGIFCKFCLSNFFKKNFIVSFSSRYHSVSNNVWRQNWMNPKNIIYEKKKQIWDFYSCLNEAIFKVWEIICNGFLKMEFCTVPILVRLHYFWILYFYDNFCAHYCYTSMFVAL